MRFLYLLFIFTVAAATAQTEHAASLLWRITGKNTAHPSYLYGTMHVKDKRVFYTNDSLPDLIAACHYFALELHPDSMNTMLFDEMDDADSTGNEFNSFDEEEYKLVNKKVQNDLGIDLNQIKNKNLKHLKRILSPTKKRQDDYPIFLDGYLLNIARRQGRTVIGLEGVQSQQTALSSFETKRDLKEQIVELSKERKEGVYEKMVKYYEKEDIESIEKVADDYSPEDRDNILYRRNKIMARTIDSIIQVNSIFAACGSAHLGGKLGVIELLKKLGYTVTPVMAAKKSYLNADRLPRNIELNWQKVSLPALGVNYMLPGAPQSYKKTILFSDTRMYMDISNGCVYMVLPMSIAVEGEKEKLFDKVLESMAKKAPDGATQKKTRGVQAGREYIELSFTLKGGYSAVSRIYIENNILYNFFITYPSTYNIDEEKNYFFNSVNIYKPVQQQTVLYANKDWGFELNLPAKPDEKKTSRKSEGKGVETLSLKTSDNIAGIHYLMECVEAGEGRYYTNDSTLLHEVYKRFKEQKEVISLKDSAFTFQNCKALEVVAVFYDNSTCVCWSFMRGFKYYNLLAIMQKKTYEAGTYKAILNSFTFLNNSSFTWQGLPGDSLFRQKLPAPFRPYNQDTTENSAGAEPLYTSYHKDYGVTYFLEKVKEEPYYYTLSDSAYWKKKEITLKGYRDSVIKSVPIRSGALAGRYIVIKEKGSTYSKHYNVFNFGDYHYNIFSNVPDCKTCGFLLEPFRNFDYRGVPRQKLVSDTAAFAHLLGDYASADSILSSKAGRALYSFEVTENMFPLLTKTIDGLSGTRHVDFKQGLIDKLSDMPARKALPYIDRKFFGPSPDTAFDDRYALALSKIRTSESYTLLKRVFDSHLGTLSKYSGAIYQVNDSAALARQFYPGILGALSKDTAENNALMYVTKALLDSSVISYGQLSKFENDLVNYTKRYINADVKDKDYLSYYFPTDPIDILSHSDNKALMPDYIAQLKRSRNIWGRYYAIYYSLKSGLAPDAVLAAQVSAQPYLRNGLYAHYQKYGRSDQFPAKYRTQRMLAEGNIFSVLVNDDELYPKEAKFIKEVKTFYNNKDVYFYIYKVNFTDDDTYNIMFAGPYYSGKELVNDAELTGLGEVYVKGREEEMLASYLRSLE